MKITHKFFLLVFSLFIINTLSFSVSAADIFMDSEYIGNNDSYTLEIDTKDYLFINSSDDYLHMLDKSTGITKELLYDSKNFITDGTTVYYQSSSENNIYRINTDGTGNSLVFNENASPIGCMDNKYLYYSQPSENDDIYSTWRLDLETQSTQLIIPYSTLDFQACNGKLYYTLFSGDNPVSDLYVSEPDGSNPYVLIKDIHRFKIIDNEIYYAKLRTDHGYRNYEFYISRCDLSGNSTEILTDNIYTTGIASIRQDTCFYYNGDGVGSIDYTPTNTIKVLLNNIEIKFDQPPLIVDGRTLVPIRAVIEAMGGSVNWNGENQTVTLVLGDKVIKLIIGSTTAFLNGETKILDVPPQIINGRTLLPIRFIAESFDFNVNWDENTKTITIMNKDTTASLIYKNKKMGYQLTFPECYKDSYRIYEYDNGSINVCFYGNSTASKNYPDSNIFPGIPLFLILPEYALNENKFLDSITKIGTVNETNYYYATGTGSSIGYLYDSLNNATDITEHRLIQADLDKIQQMKTESVNITINKLSSVDVSPQNSLSIYKDVSNTMPKNLLDEFNSLICSEARTAEIAPYNNLESFDCDSNNNIRELMWYFMTDYANIYLGNIPEFHMFNGTNIEFFHEDELLRVQSYLLDMVIHEYYNIPGEIPKFEKISEYDTGSLYYSNYYYFYTNYFERVNNRYRPTHNYKAFIENVYDLGNNRYYFKYKLGTSLIGYNADTVISDNTYHVILERKHLDNESFTNLEFWSIIKASTEEIEISNNLSLSLERIPVSCQELSCECKQYGIIRAYRNNKLIWEHTTETVPMTELESISDVHINQQTAYISVCDSLYALDIDNGNVKWSVSNVGAGNCIIFDLYDNIYISGYYGPNLMVIDKNGHILYEDNDSSYGWVNKLIINENSLYIYYDFSDSGDTQTKIIDITQFKSQNMS